MGAKRYITGDQEADKVLRLVFAHVEALPGPQREDLQDGVRSLPFNYRYLVGQTGLDSVEVRRALKHLHEHGYLRVDFGHPRGDGSACMYGVHVWLRSRLESAA